MKIGVIGIGYVGLSNAVLLAQHNHVVALDLDEEKVIKINNKISPIFDKEIEFFFKNVKLNLKATLNFNEAIAGASFVVIATPTDYDPINNYFDTTAVDVVIEKVYSKDPKIPIIIKSTVPVGYINNKKKQYTNLKIIFSPEFLREGNALYDNLYPTRIIVGDHSNDAKRFAKLLVKSALKKNIPVLFTNPTEAEAIKLFSNSYLAMRVAFFNELDTYAELHKLDSREIITGVGLDPRIGSHYNNPSFGYGGYCLPKDTKQLLANFNEVPHKIIKAIVESNEIRKSHIASMVLQKKPKVVGIHRLIMKSNSDNFRQSAIQDIIYKLDEKIEEIVIYEPVIKEERYDKFPVIKDLEMFKKYCDVIITNRFDKTLSDVKEKIYSRDIFNRD